MSASDRDRVEITSLLDQWIEAFKRKDYETIRTLWDDSYDGLVYQAEEFEGPLTTWLRIKHYYREVLTKLIESVDEWKRTNLWINAIGDMGFGYMVSDFQMTVRGVPEPYKSKVRQTFVVRRSNGRFRIIHYHESLQTMATPEQFRLDDPD